MHAQPTPFAQGPEEEDEGEWFEDEEGELEEDEEGAGLTQQWQSAGAAGASDLLEDDEGELEEPDAEMMAQLLEGEPLRGRRLSAIASRRQRGAAPRTRADASDRRSSPRRGAHGG